MKWPFKWVVLLVLVGCVKGSGVSTGKLIDVSEEGIIFTSCEIDMQYGEGSSKMTPSSTRDMELCAELKSLVNKTVEIKYRHWIGPVITMGSHDEVMAVKSLEKGE